MRKLALGIGVAALLGTAAFAGEPTASSTSQATDDTKVATVDTSSSAFSKLDADHDGRISAIEAANDSQLSAAFSQGDADKDGYLSREEFKSVGKMKSGSSTNSTSSAPTQSDTSSTPPPQQ